ncbi:MAG: LysR substrate-binding domain-containing protein [Hyphomicrobiales bacterium]|nr:LysR substrate-binding domain-containing protein [Hyphomicrobiales bacterium]
METRILGNFLRVAETGKFSQAAAELNLAQPALSRQMALLEEDVGAQLFVRHRRGVTLTDAGALFRQRAEEILASVEQARAAVSSAGLEPTGTVTLGLPTSMIYVLSGDLIETYRARFPGVFLRIHEAVGHVIEALLKESRLDAAILIEPRPMPGVALTPLIEEDIYLVGPGDAGLSLEAPVTPATVAEVPMIMLAPENHVRSKIEAALSRAGASFNAALEVEGQPLAFDLVRRGLGYTLLPYCAVRAEMAAGHISGAPIAGLSLGWTLGVNRTRAGAPAVSALIETIQELVDERTRNNEWRVPDGRNV